MAWSSDSDEEDRGWTLEANRGRRQHEVQQMARGNHDELWNLYRCLLEYCRGQGYPFFRGGTSLAFADFADFVVRFS